MIRRIAAGDQAALGEFYDLTSRQVFGVARQVLHNDSDAEEVTMAVYLEVWRRAKDYDIQRGRPMTWLLMMARSRAIDALRMQRPGRQLPMESVTNENYPASLESPNTVQDVEQSLLAIQRGDLVHKALQNLSPDQRQVIELTFFLGLTNQEIADRLAIPLGTVKGRLRLALQHLRRWLGPAMKKGWL
ncbi:RNA polymerase sigma factor, sigma-70 family [Chloracidobacterium thermophilum B]|uniref:RNA polymerase sigma factor, sigma-70 family n=1 Tax=Chloracidobacterium thermophilum (strain B) TaxID=981222 RepID=G2LGA4_CHLTF|nr:RNA polymerase sigma factor, sigma-70 family [Chloracidobacterium thermophilum B]